MSLTTYSGHFHNQESGDIHERHSSGIIYDLKEAQI
jgi:hypothetical protein